MKSPTSGREMELKTEKRSLEYHGQRFTIDYSFYWCDVTGQEYLDDFQIYNHKSDLHSFYCKKNKFLLPYEIASIRSNYNLSEFDFSIILGISLEELIDLENGNILNSNINEKLIQIQDPKYFLQIVDKYINRLTNYSEIKAAAELQLKLILSPEQYYGQHTHPDETKESQYQKYWSYYSLPNDLKRLLNLNARKDFDTATIGFNLDFGNQSYFGPLDFMVFGYSGGDGGLFGFLTDFGYYEDLNKAPIVFNVPIDFWFEHPSYSIKMVAANFREFLSLMITMWSAEILRTYSVFAVDYSAEIPQCRLELAKYDQELRLSTIKIIKEEFGIEEIPDVEAYFLTIYAERTKNPDFIELVDGLGINFRNIDSKKLKEAYLSLKSNVDPAILFQQFDAYQRKMFIREDTFTYYRQENFSDAYRYQVYLDRMKEDLSPNELMNLESMITLQKAL